MTRQLKITPQAASDIEDLAYYLALEASVATAMRFEQAVMATGQGLFDFPFANPRYDAPPFSEFGLRKTAIKGFPNHLMFYLVDEQTITIARVLHGARDLPGALAEEADEDGA